MSKKQKKEGEDRESSAVRIDYFCSRLLVDYFGTLRNYFSAVYKQVNQFVPYGLNLLCFTAVDGRYTYDTIVEFT